MSEPKMEHHQDGVTHIHFDICSINIRKIPQGIVVDVWERDFEGAEPVATTWAHINELTNSGYENDDDQ